MSIIAPHIKNTDTEDEWQKRTAKVLLIRSWRLPQQWGTGLTCINMAEALGFIIGKYTIPMDLPVIYITDSNNARALKRNVKNKNKFTHQQMIRHVKQGIDQSIANHLEKLTDKWYNKEELSNSALETYNRGVDVCIIWTNQYNASEHEHDTYNSDNLASWTEDSGSYFSYGSSYESFRNNDTNRKYSFYESTYDLLGRVIIIKVYSHQTKTDFTKNNHTSKLCPNRFAVTANQIADNAATQCW
jgi:hypothetical protein